MAKVIPLSFTGGAMGAIDRFITGNPIAFSMIRGGFLAIVVADFEKLMEGNAAAIARVVLAFIVGAMKYGEPNPPVVK